MYLLRRPDATLQAYIEHYWFVLDEAGEPVDLRVEVFVDARADLIFNFGAPYRREVIHGPVQELADSNFDAQRLVPIRIAQRGRVRVGGVRFHLGGVAAFTGRASRTSPGRHHDPMPSSAQAPDHWTPRSGTSGIRTPRPHSWTRSSSSCSSATARIRGGRTPCTRCVPATDSRR